MLGDIRCYFVFANIDRKNRFKSCDLVENCGNGI